MDRLIATFGAGPVAALLCLCGLLALAMPLWTWHARGGWTHRQARVAEIAARRSLASGTWPVLITYEADGEWMTTVPVNLIRQPLTIGEQITILHHPKHPGRAVTGRWQGASTPLMVGLFLLLGAVAVLRN